MTLIVAIQTEDSIIVAADNRFVSATPNGDGRPRYHSDQNKLYLWDGGVVTGCGIAQIPREIKIWLQQNQVIDSLPQRLLEIKKQHCLEVSAHEQVTNTKIVFSMTEKSKPQLYLLGLQQPIEKATSNELLVFFPLEHDMMTSSMASVYQLKSASGGSAFAEPLF